MGGRQLIFSSSMFLFFFLPVTLFFYFIVADRYRNIVLIIASLFFYAWGEPKNVLLMILSIAINYIFGFCVEKKWVMQKPFLIISIIYNLGILFVFKYLNFAVDTLNSLVETSIEIQKIALPIGISFYTFQIMSYVIDVYKGTVKVQKNILNLCLYVSLFPQLIAGPIVRYADVEKQIVSRNVSLEKCRSGIIRFCMGFSKKVLIADSISTLVDVCFTDTYPSMLLKWVGAISYALQIYYDFSGYSDMAIGLGRILGFDFLENFNFPYISKSIQEFWRRWHISLSSWFRDYLYIPLGGNRKGKLRTYINLAIVFFMTGLWHGAGFNFIVWGLYYALFLIIERLGFGEILKKLPNVVRHIYAIFIILIGWIFFRADSLGDALIYIKGLFTLNADNVTNFNYIMNRQYWFVLIIGIILSMPHEKIISIINNKNMQILKECIILLVFLIAIFYMVGSGYSPFLYFRF